MVSAGLEVSLVGACVEMTPMFGLPLKVVFDALAPVIAYML